jgi:hypothetical protein
VYILFGPSFKPRFLQQIRIKKEDQEIYHIQIKSTVAVAVPQENPNQPNFIHPIFSIFNLQSCKKTRWILDPMCVSSECSTGFGFFGCLLVHSDFDQVRFLREIYYNLLNLFLNSANIVFSFGIFFI